MCTGYMIFIKNNEINESHKLCQVRGKHTVGGIVFYKHLFLVFVYPHYKFIKMCKFLNGDALLLRDVTPVI